MKSNILIFFLVLISGNVKADCWFDCDTANRNLSTDFAKVTEYLDRAFSRKRRNSGVKYFCGKESNNEITMFSVYKDREKELLIINAGRFSPPDYGASNWKRVGMGYLKPFQVMKKLNFGLSGIANSLSDDKRCRAIYKGLSELGDNFFLACTYKYNEDLPISKSVTAKYSSFYSLDRCMKK